MKHKRVVGAGVLILCALLATAWFSAGNLVAAHHQVIGAAPADLLAQNIELESASGARLAGWHVPVARSHAVIVIVHGIHASRLAMIERARMLRRNGYSSLLIDLQGHGESGGERVTIGHLEREDVRAAVAYAKTNHPGERVGVIGVSLGGAAALIASPLGVDAMVVESVYPTIKDAIENRVKAALGSLYFVPAWLLRAQLKLRLGVGEDELRPIAQISRAGCPVLVASGAIDAHTTVSETRALFAAAIEPKQLWIVDGAGHVDLERADPLEYERRITKFFETSFAIK